MTIAVVIISKDEPGLRETLCDIVSAPPFAPTEVVVVDASSGRLGAIERDFPEVRWVDHIPETRFSIAAQRNSGLSFTSDADVVVFTDAGCRVEPNWLEELVSPIVAGEEQVTAGLTKGTGPWSGLYEPSGNDQAAYLCEAPTINLALSRRVIDEVGKFDECFEYGSDIDYTWRIAARSIPIRFVPSAVVTHDWGNRQRQMRRSYRYGKARARLHRKHTRSVAELVRKDPVLVAYPLFLLGLPVTFWLPPYPLLLLVPAWRARHAQPGVVLIDHLLYGAGALAEAWRWTRPKLAVSDATA